MLYSALKYYWWVIVLGVAFMPNFSGEIATPVGSAEQSDILLIPLALCLYTFSSPSTQTLYKRLKAPVLLFLGVATFSTLTIPLRYEYPIALQGPLLFSLVKLAKFILYIEVARRLLIKLSTVRTFTSMWFPATIALVSIAIAITLKRLFSIGDLAFEANNAVSVYMATLLSYLTSIYIHRKSGTKSIPGFPIIAGITVVAILVSGGRGGWFAAAAGILWSLYKAGVSLRTIGIILLFVFGGGAFIWSQEEVYIEVLRTFRLGDSSQYRIHHAETRTIDDGARLISLQAQVPRLAYAPIVGSGFFHRGGLSRLWWTGSHNFYIQMLLETGILGFAALIAFSRKMWAQARLVENYLPRMSIATQSGLIAAFVGSMGGEYFYGGLGIFVIALVYAPVGICIDAREQ